MDDPRWLCVPALARAPAPSGTTAMRIDQLLGRGQPAISFEFFPPKTDAGFNQLLATVEELRPLEPSYVSVTYGAGGSTREKTVDLTVRIQRDLGIRSMAHLTCVGHTADELGGILDDLWAGGVRNVLALRGDPPAGAATFTKTEGGFAYADELAAFAAARHDFCVAVAGYPEGHPQCLNRTRDLENLKRKVDAGGRLVITQLFFDNAEFYRFRDEAERAGIKVPEVAGIMPITNVSQIKRFIGMCGAKIPHPLLTRLESLEQDPESVYRAGIDHATEQCADLLKQQVAGLHYYTLNKSKATADIAKRLNFDHAF
ncbi:MAG: methylenetetrahydrofolate reductase [Phycisphaerales bacterium]|nr:methylenetetrahydrofolate reductase [Phycisphaerales bacterium]